MIRLFKFALLFHLLLLGSCSSVPISSVRDESLSKHIKDAKFIDIPFVRQETPHSCGAAALSSVFSYWSKPLDQSYIIRQFPLLSKYRGYSLGELKVIADENGFQSFVLKSNLDNLKEQIALGRPIIIPIETKVGYKTWERSYSHFVVLVGFSKDGFILMDPVEGFVFIRENQLDKLWAREEKAILLVAPLQEEEEEKAKILAEDSSEQLRKGQPNPIAGLPSSEPDRFVIRLSACRIRENAEKVCSQFQKEGYDAVVRDSRRATPGRLYVVELKPMNDLPMAKSVMAKIQEQGKFQPLMISHLRKMPEGVSASDVKNHPAPSPASERRRFVIRVATCRMKANAEGIRNKLLARGYECTINAHPHSKFQQVHTVELDPVDDLDKAQSLMTLINHEENLKPVLLQNRLN